MYPLKESVQVVHLRVAVRVLAASICLAGLAQAQQTPDLCGVLRTGAMYGPYDYVKEPDKVPIVNQGHFSDRVERLLGGKSSSTPGGDLNYTLRAIPNHHRALVAAERFAEKTKQDPPPEMQYTVECWYERALRLSPEDHVARLLYASYLARQKKGDDADRQLKWVLLKRAAEPFTVNNVGLIYLEMGRPEEALAQAHAAEALGMTRSPLRLQLEKRGLWRNPSASEAVGTAASAPAGAASAGR